MKSAEIFRPVPQPVSFVNDLPPSILTGCFCCKRNQSVCWKGRIVVRLLRRKDKIRLFVSFRYCLCGIRNAVSVKDGRQMMFKAFSGTAFPTIQNHVCHRNKGINRIKATGNCLSITGVFNRPNRAYSVFVHSMIFRSGFVLIYSRWL